MTVDYFMQHLADPNQLYNVGSKSGFFFIGTRLEWNKCIDALSRKRLKHLKNRRKAAKREVERAQGRLNRKPVKLIFGKDLEGTIAYLNSVVIKGSRQYVHFNRLVKAFTPFRAREIKDIYSRATEIDGTNISLTAWTHATFGCVKNLRAHCVLENMKRQRRKGLRTT